MRLPPVTRSLRFRLSGMTAGVVFGIGALALGAVYGLVLVRLRSLTVPGFVITNEPVDIGGITVLRPRFTPQEFQTIEGQIREAVLNQVSLITLSVLVLVFLMSLAVGWFVAGRALRPLDRMTSVAREIEATDLSRRIGLDGPDDELTRMAGTFDAMLERLERAFTAQQRFLAQTSHDLRTPLAVIRSNIEVAASDPDAGVEEWRATGEIVSRAAERMSAMIDDLLAAARLEAGTATLLHLDLGELVGEVAAEMRARAEAAGIELAVDARPAAVEGDRTALLRGIGNLVDNALRAAPTGSTLGLASGTADGWAFVAVRDEGPGFDPGSARPGGLGLGIVSEIARAHGGSFSVLSRPDAGSLAVLWIPAAGEQRGAVPAPESLEIL